jgi:serine/threonine protein kinase
VLLDDNFEAKLCDFGQAKVKAEVSTHSSYPEKVDRVGTVRWRAPEVFGLKPRYSTASDMWAFGVILWELFSLKIPYADAPDDDEIRSSLRSGEREEIPEDCPADLARLIKRCWSEKPEERPSAMDAVAELEKTLEPMQQRHKLKPTEQLGPLLVRVSKRISPKMLQELIMYFDLPLNINDSLQALEALVNSKTIESENLNALHAFFTEHQHLVLVDVIEEACERIVK